MKVRSIRHIVADSNHNMCTGAQFFQSYYSNHTAPVDPRICQWDHPGIYLVDAIFESEQIPQWQVSELQPLPTGGLGELTCPDATQTGGKWHTLKPAGPGTAEPGFVDAHLLIAGRNGVIFFSTELEIGPVNRGVLHFGYDGPIRAWLNGQEVFAGPGTNPAIADQTSVPVHFHHGTNRIAIALDTNGGKAWGIFGRYEITQF